MLKTKFTMLLQNNDFGDGGKIHPSLIILKICTNPKYPNTGNKNLTKLENPKFEISTPVMHIIPAICENLSLFFTTFSKKLIPIEIDVVKIESKIIIP